MGFFSWDCRECGNSIRSDVATRGEISSWMNDVVVHTPGGSVLFGSYDGYGRVGTFDLSESSDISYHHRACWELAGKPSYAGPSRDAIDQGYFVGEYDPPTPTTVEDIALLKLHSATERERVKEFWQQRAAERERVKEFWQQRAR